MAIPLVHVAGHFEKPDSTNEAGTVTFTLSDRVRDAAANIVYDPNPVVVTLASGAFTHDLIANNHVDADPPGTHYTVAVNIPPLAPYSFDIVVPNVTDLDLADALVVTTPAAVAAYATAGAVAQQADDLAVLVAMGGF